MQTLLERADSEQYRAPFELLLTSGLRIGYADVMTDQATTTYQRRTLFVETFTVLSFQGPEGFELAAFPSVREGLSLPHTPDGFAYYLDQAAMAETVNANSAAAAWQHRRGHRHLRPTAQLRVVHDELPARVRYVA